MSSAVLEKAQTALIAYQTFQLRLAMAISLAQLLEPEEIVRRTIGEAVDSVNQSIGFPLDELPKQGTSSISNGLSLLDLIEGFTDRHPLIVFHLRSILGDCSSPIIKRAIQAHPHCEFLYQWYFSPHRSFRATQPEIRKRYLQRMVGRMDFPKRKRRLYFSPMLQISIGHWFHLCNSIRCADALGMECPPITVFVAEIDSGLSLIEFLNASGSATISVESHDSVLDYPLIDARELYCSDYYLADIPPHSKNVLQKHINALVDNETYSDIAFIHLRTAIYKNDHHSYHASLRNVDPHTYVGAAQYLQKNALVQPVLITADTIIPTDMGLSIHQVTDKETEHVQWRLIRDSKFSVGTPSGISHLFNLGSGCTLRTNNNGLAMEDIFSSIHLIACKRFSVDRRLLEQFSVTHLAYLVCLPWEIPNGLASFATIRDLSHDELTLVAKEFLDIYQGNCIPQTLYDIFNSLDLLTLTNVVPNRNVSTTTAADIMRTLSFYSSAY